MATNAQTEKEDTGNTDSPGVFIFVSKFISIFCVSVCALALNVSMA